MATYPQIKVKHNIGNTIEIPNQLDVKTSTYLSDNKAVGAISLPVDNATNFSSGTILLLLSSMGAQNAEIVSSASHTTNAFTTAATLMTHSRGDIIQEINYDQVLLSYCATIDGVYTPLTPTTIQVTQQSTVIYHAAGAATTYYKVQWRNSLGAFPTSDLSAPISVDTTSVKSVGNVISPVLLAMGVSENDPKITTTFCLSAVDDARKYVKAKLYGIRHAWNQEFEHPIKTLAGTNFVDLPDNIDFNETDRSMLAARFLIGNVLTPYNLRYIDKRSWNQIAFSVMGGYTVTNTLLGDTVIILDSAGDFPASAPYAGPGLVATNGTATLTGTNTTFLTTFMVGDVITVSGETPRIILTIPSNVALTTTVAFTTTAGGLSYLLTNGGVAYVATSNYTQTILQFSYQYRDITTNQLFGVKVQNSLGVLVPGITRSIPVGTRIWSRPTISQPIYYTVFEDRLFFDRIIPDSMQGNNLYIDYYKRLDPVVSLSQELDEPYREIYKWYLRYAIKYRKDIALGSDDPDLKKFEDLVQALFNNLYTGQDTTVITG